MDPDKSIEHFQLLTQCAQSHLQLGIAVNLGTQPGVACGALGLERRNRARQGFHHFFLEQACEMGPIASKRDQDLPGLVQQDPLRHLLLERKTVANPDRILLQYHRRIPQ